MAVLPRPLIVSRQPTRSVPPSSSPRRCSERHPPHPSQFASPVNDFFHSMVPSSPNPLPHFSPNSFRIASPTIPAATLLESTLIKKGGRVPVIVNQESSLDSCPKQDPDDRRFRSDRKGSFCGTPTRGCALPPVTSHKSRDPNSGRV